MKAIRFLPVLMLAAWGLRAQTPTVGWLKTISQVSSQDELNFLSTDFWTDPAGRSFVACVFSETIDLGQNIQIEAPEGSTAILVAAYAADGALLWHRTINSLSKVAAIDDYVRITGDNSGNVFVSCSFPSPGLDFGNGVSLASSCSDCEEIFVAKYSSGGLPQWAKALRAENGATHESGGIACDPAGNLYLSGTYGGSFMQIGNGVPINNLPGTGFFLAKLNPQADPIWARFLEPNSGPANCETLCASPTGDVFVGGYYDSETLRFSPTLALESFADGGYYFARYDGNGNPIWAKNLHSPNYLDVLDIDADAQNRLYVVGDFSNALNSGTNDLLVSETEYAAAVVRFDNTATTVPQVVNYNEENYPIMAVATAPNGGYHAGGNFETILDMGDFDINAQGCIDASMSFGSEEMVLNAYNLGGAEGCEGIVNFSKGSVMDVDAAGNLYVVGAYLSNLDIQPFERTGTGLFVAKLNTGTVSTSSPSDDTARFQLSPNPTAGGFQVRFDALPESGWLVLSALNGQEIYRQRVQSTQHTFDLQLPEGLYLVQLQDQSGVHTQKLVVQR